MKWLPFQSAVRRIRLKSEPGDQQDQYLQMPLTEAFDYLDVLSLGLSERDLFQLRQADYGVVAGRVLANGGVGVPNCRVSIFIPAGAQQGPAGELLRQRYPWQVVGPEDVDANGRRYNLLPDQQSFRGYNGYVPNELGIGATPITPVGSFPEREAVLTDPVAREVHEQYYRHTTVTNESGDFVLMGIPIGSHVLHLDGDLTDIGRWSFSPIILRQTLGYPSAQFEDDGRKIRASTDLDSMAHLVSLNAQITVRPLWGQDGGRVSLGLTRQDFKIPVPLRPHFTLAGSLFSMGRNRWWGDRLKFRLHFGLRNLCVTLGQTFCMGESSCSLKTYFCAGIDVSFFPTVKVGNCDNRPNDKFFFCAGFSIPNVLPFFRLEFRDDYCRLNGGKYDSSPLDIINHGATCECDVQKALEHVPDDGLSAALMLSAHRPEEPDLRLFSLTDEVSEEQAIRWSLPLETGHDQIGDADFVSFDPRRGVRRVSATEYLEISEPGQFILQPFCNRRPMITREDGLLVDSPDPRLGVMTEFRGYLYVKGKESLDAPSTSDASARVALKVPQSFDYDYNFGSDGVPYLLDTHSRVPEWVFRHGHFKAGGLYSVAQRIATRRALLSEADEQRNDTSFESKDADGSVYKKGWDIQTGLIVYTDTPVDRRDRLPANNVTYMGVESEYTQAQAPVVVATPTVPYQPPLNFGSGAASGDFDPSVYADGNVGAGITLKSPTGTSYWTSGQTVSILYNIDGSVVIPNDRLTIEIFFISPGGTAKDTPFYVMFGTNTTQLFAIDQEISVSPAQLNGDPAYFSWLASIGPKPATMGRGGPSSANVNFDFVVRVVVRSIEDPAIHGVSPAFNFRLV